MNSSTPQRKATTITVKAFFSGYILAGMDGQEFDQLPPEQRLRAQLQFMQDRARHILNNREGMPLNAGSEARNILKAANAAQQAIEQGDPFTAAMHCINAGRWMEKIMSGQLASLTLEYADRPSKANKAKISKLEIARNQVIKLWLSQPRGRGEAERFSDTEAARLNSKGQKITSNTIRKDWISKKGISEYQNTTK